ncbi:MAG: hypothetical protein JKY54_08115 [Flavobacteriales bacterium]|nr:hypothetical protein [Flavobacteriales bacterium]
MLPDLKIKFTADTSQAQTGTEQYVKELDRFEQVIDGASAASVEYERSIKKITAAQKIGSITTASANALNKAAALRLREATLAANNLSVGMARVNGVSGASRFAIQNAASQFGDMAVQMEMGTSTMRIMGQQLPQLLGGFAGLSGTLGLALPLLGAVAAIGFPIAAAFLMMSDGAENAEDRIQSLSDVTNILTASLERARLSNEALTRVFGEGAETVRILSLSQAQNSANIARRQIAESSNIVATLVDDYTKLAREAERIAAGGPIREFTSQLEKSSEALQEMLGVGKEQAAEFSEVFLELSRAVEFDDQIDGLLNMIALMKEYDVPLANLPVDLQQAIGSMSQYGIEVALATELTKQLAAETQNMNTGTALFDQLLPDGLSPPEESPLGSGKGRRKKKAVDPVDAYNSLRAAMDPVFSATQAFAKAQDTLNKALQAGAIDQTEFNETLELAQERLDDAVQATSQYQTVFDTIETSMSSAFDALTDKSMSAADKIKAVLSDIIKALYEVMVVQQLVGSFDMSSGTGSGIVGAIGSMLNFEGGGSTPGGTRSGGVDGRGGMLAVVHPNEDIIDNNVAGGGRSGGGGGTTIISNVAVNVSTGVQATVQAEIVAHMPQITDASLAGVLDAVKRGGAVRKVF